MRARLSQGVENTVRNVSSAEAAVVRSLLSAERTSLRERARRSSIPPRTFTDVQGRVYGEGWLEDRYIPDLEFVRRPFVTFILAEPYIERAAAVAESWQTDPSVVLLLRSPESFFAVVCGSDPKGHFPGTKDVTDAVAMRRSVSLTVDSRGPGIPVYFDFEAAWDRLAGLRGTYGYPHGWRCRSAPSENEGEVHGEASDPAPLSASQRSVLASLLRRPFESAEGDRGAGRSSPFFLPRSQLRLLSKGLASYRVFLHPQRIPPFDGHQVERLVYVAGTLRQGEDAQTLLRALVQGSRVTPFLYAYSSSRVVFGALSPVSASRVGPRDSVSATLEAYLSDIEVQRQSLNALSTVVDHRYDRLLA